MRVSLIGKPYTSKSIIASNQRSVNLYAEINDDPQAPTPITHYAMPGTSLFGTPAAPAATRCFFRTSLDTAYVIIGPTVYFVASNGALIFVGTIPDRVSQVSMADNGLVVVLVDGVNGWVIDMTNNAFAQIVDPSFYGADFVLFLDTFFIFNRPDTNQFYISLSEANFGMLSGTGVGDGTIVGGAGYVDGSYDSVPLTGGTGTGATASISVQSGLVGTGSIVAPGTLYTNGVYNNIPLTGGTGSGATANITIAGGAVTGVALVQKGSIFTVGDDLSADPSLIGGTGSGFLYNVDTVINGAVVVVSPENFGQDYTVGDVLSASNADLGGSGAGFTYTIDAFALAFDPLDIAAKSGSADHIVGLATAQKELWLIGELTTEIWIGTGAADFFYQQVQGAYINHGCIAPFSISTMDVLTCWIMQDKQGKGIVVTAAGYSLDEISTPAIVSEFRKYPTLADAVGTMFQIEDHAFYVISLPTANKTWCVEVKTKLWCELEWLNVEDGSVNRHRMQYAAFAFGKNLIADWETGNILNYDIDLLDDNGDPIIHLRTFMHMVGGSYNRIIYKNFDADVEVATTSISDDDVTAGANPPKIELSWSDDRGKTFGFPVPQSLGTEGNYLTTVSWNRLGMARDRVFKLQWSDPVKTALNGAFVELEELRS